MCNMWFVVLVVCEECVVCGVVCVVYMCVVWCAVLVVCVISV